MPELPEVETTLRGIKPHIIGRKISEVNVRNRNLRWPVSRKVYSLAGSKFIHIKRRGKYILIDVNDGTLLIHLGMSGSLRIVKYDQEFRKHDHVDIKMDSGKSLRYHDPRRFGCFLFHSGNVNNHKLLKHLGPEPLDEEFCGEFLYSKSRGRNVSIKQFIMNAQTVVGVGNIYACEALFFSGINPKRSASKISRERYNKLAENIKMVLQSSIKMGGTTLRDFVNEVGEPGYFKQSLMVYGREEEQCTKCDKAISRIVQTGRSTFYCSSCQR